MATRCDVKLQHQKEMIKTLLDVDLVCRVKVFYFLHFLSGIILLSICCTIVQFDNEHWIICLLYGKWTIQMPGMLLGEVHGHGEGHFVEATSQLSPDFTLDVARMCKCQLEESPHFLL